MDLSFDDGTGAAAAAAAIAAIEHQVHERYPMIGRLLIEAGSGPRRQRWSRPDAIRRVADSGPLEQSPQSS